MRRILKVARREYAETVRTKTFLLSLLVTPLLIGVVIYFSERTQRAMTGPRPPRKVGLVDLSKDLADEITASFEGYNKSHAGRKILLEHLSAETGDAEAILARGKDDVRAGKLDVCVVVMAGVVGGKGGMRLYTRTTKAADLEVLGTVEDLLNHAVVTRRCALRNVSPELLAELRRRVPAEQVELGTTDSQERVRKKRDTMIQLMVPFFFMFLMFMGIFGMGQHMITSVIEEKNSRVIELLLSALSPFQLMAGKIMGLAGIGLTVIGLWAAAAVGAACWKDLNVDVPGELVVYFAVYYVLGFVLLSSILAGVGSICNTIKEAQGLLMPITMIFIVPMVTWMMILRDPNGTLARVLSFLPPLTPMVMVLRISAGGPSAIEVAASVVVLAASVLAAMWVAGKVFRTGILMYGKRPGVREVLRWVRQN